MALLRKVAPLETRSGDPAAEPSSGRRPPTSVASGTAPPAGMRGGGKEHLMYRPVSEEGLDLVGRSLGLTEVDASSLAVAERVWRCSKLNRAERC